MNNLYREERETYFQKKMRPLQHALSTWELPDQKQEQSIYALYFLYEEIMLDIFVNDVIGSNTSWQEMCKTAGEKAFLIFQNLNVDAEKVYGKEFLKNKSESTGHVPDQLEFHVDIDAIEDLLNYCILGTSDQKIYKLKNNIRGRYDGTT